MKTFLAVVLLCLLMMGMNHRLSRLEKAQHEMVTTQEKTVMVMDQMADLDKSMVRFMEENFRSNTVRFELYVPTTNEWGNLTNAFGTQVRPLGLKADEL